MDRELTIETERLLLRPVARDDLEEFVRLHRDPEVIRFMEARDREWLETWMERSLAEWEERGHGALVIEEAGSGRFLGRTGLKYWPQFDETEVGWVLRPEARGHGFATEAAGAALRWGFERFEPPYVTAMIRPDNPASVAVAERLGMSPMREDELLGVLVTVYSIER